MFSFAAKVDIGVYEHQNDDRALIGTDIIEDGEYSGKREASYILAAVCDGVGGMACGYRAATLTLEMTRDLDMAGQNRDDIKNAIELANKKILDIQNAENMKNGLRTTIAGIYSDGERGFIFNAGDSRVYRFRYRYLSQLSKDHSLVQDMIDMGEITASEARTHAKKNIITKCIGNEEEVNPRIICMDDFYDGDVIMICSDGICDEVLNSEIKEILINHGQDENLLACCNLLHEKAIENGSKDNMSVILLRKEKK